MALFWSQKLLLARTLTHVPRFVSLQVPRQDQCILSLFDAHISCPAGLRCMRCSSATPGRWQCSGTSSFSICASLTGNHCDPCHACTHPCSHLITRTIHGTQTHHRLIILTPGQTMQSPLILHAPPGPPEAARHSRFPKPGENFKEKGQPNRAPILKIPSASKPASWTHWACRCYPKMLPAMHRRELTSTRARGQSPRCRRQMQSHAMHLVQPAQVLEVSTCSKACCIRSYRCWICALSGSRGGRLLQKPTPAVQVPQQSHILFCNIAAVSGKGFFVFSNTFPIIFSHYFDLEQILVSGILPDAEASYQ